MRQAVLDAARQLFRDERYDTLSVERIAAFAGVTRYSLNNHFSSKADIFRTSRESIISELEELIGSDIAADTDTAAGIATFLKRCLSVFSDARAAELRQSVVLDAEQQAWLDELFDKRIRHRLRSVGETFLLYRSKRLDECLERPRIIAEELLIIAEALADSWTGTGSRCLSGNTIRAHIDTASNAFAALLTSENADPAPSGSQ